ncbi:MAG: isochorismatase family protein, partial [Sandaracinaceae bacterium]
MTPDKLSLRPDGTALLVIDVQDKLAAAMPEDGRARTLRNLSSLIEGARLFWMPVLFTEQYPQGLGHTVPELARLRDGFDRAVPVVEKREFSAT